MNETCLFCQIANGKLDTELIATSEHGVAFDDIAPVAPVHVLVIPKQHVRSLRELENPVVAADLLALASKVAEERGLYDLGYRVVTNDGEIAGQTVHHLHFHVLGGQRLGGMG